jgi:hypothetical protein
MSPLPVRIRREYGGRPENPAGEATVPQRIVDSNDPATARTVFISGMLVSKMGFKMLLD